MQRQKHMRLIFYVFGIILSATTYLLRTRDFGNTNFPKRIFKRQVWKAGWKSALEDLARMAFPHWIMLK